MHKCLKRLRRWAYALIPDKKKSILFIPVVRCVRLAILAMYYNKATALLGYPEE